MPDAFDLGQFVDALRSPEDGPAVDRSGKPAPTNVRVQLDSGVIVRCDVRYQGVNPVDGDRVFTVIAEIDWENYHPKLLLIEEMPSDVEFRFRIPGMPDAEANAVCAALDCRYDRVVWMR